MKKPMSLTEIGVHAAHCCPRHGCKYGDIDCPVVKGVVEGRVCDDCAAEEEKEIARLHAIYEGVFKDLDKKECHVIKLRLGFIDGVEHSKEEVSILTGMSVDQITGLEISVIRTLRSRFRASWADNSAGRVLD